MSRLSVSFILCGGYLLSLLSLETQMLGHYHFIGSLGAQTWGLSLSNTLSTGAAVSVLVGRALPTLKMYPLIPRDSWSCLMLLAWQWNQSANLQDMSWMGLIWGPLRSLALRLFTVHMGRVSAIWLIIFSCQRLPWPQPTNNTELPFCSEFPDEPAWWLDKLQFGERSIARAH